MSHVYLLVKFEEQKDFADRYGENASACSEVIGVYESEELAELEKSRFIKIVQKEADAEKYSFGVVEHSVINENDVFLKRYEAVMERLSTDALLSLPEDVKSELKKVKNLKDKVFMLEEIAYGLNC